jgi:protein-disulfide isomerase
MNGETKLFAGIMGATLILVVVVAVLLGNKSAVKIVDSGILVNQASQILGAADAKVTIVEFSDFECPACKIAQPTVEEIMNKYRDKVRFVYRNFPLPSHPNSWPAAQALEGANLQGKYWEMHKSLFEKSPDLSKEQLFQYAKDLNLDMDKFEKDFDSDVVREKILKDLEDGNKAGLKVTPTFFINGTRFDGALSVDEFSREIDSRL